MIIWFYSCIEISVENEVKIIRQNYFEPEHDINYNWIQSLKLFIFFC